MAAFDSWSSPSATTSDYVPLRYFVSEATYKRLSEFERGLYALDRVESLQRIAEATTRLLKRWAKQCGPEWQLAHAAWLNDREALAFAAALESSEQRDHQTRSPAPPSVWHSALRAFRTVRMRCASTAPTALC